jgi:hypothetical protein
MLWRIRSSPYTAQDRLFDVSSLVLACRTTPRPSWPWKDWDPTAVGVVPLVGSGASSERLS